MKPLHHVVLILSAAALISAPLMASAAPLDSPSVSVVRASRTSIVLEIQAGPSGAPGGVWLDWTDRATYDVNGWSGYLVYCSFAGTPTLNTWGASSFQLGPNEAVQIEVGDLFDEEGYVATYEGELELGTEYVFRAFSNPSGGSTASPYSSTAFMTTNTASPQNCTYTQGYWKNHEELWPTLSLTLGTVSYTKAQLLDILNKPAKGNGLVFLAHQLIAAKLNEANGAVLPAATQTAIADADALIGNKVIPPVGSGSLSPSTASPLTEDLDQFNNGLAGLGHCGVVATEATTWGRLKSTNR